MPRRAIHARVAAEEFAKLVEQKTNGEVSVNIAGSEQLGNDVAMLTSLRTGALDMTANSQGALSGLVPEVGALGLPFLFANAAHAFRVLDGPVGQELARSWPASASSRWPGGTTASATSPTASGQSRSRRTSRV